MDGDKQKWIIRMKPLIAVVFLQFGLAGMDVLSKAALNKGMSNYVFVVYRHAVAFVVIAPFAVILDKKVRPKMTFSIFMKIVALSVLEPVIDQNLYFLGMKYTTATFAVTMYNILPAITFMMACILKLEKIKMKSIRSQAKVAGTLATVAGAMVMTLIKGPVLELFGKHGSNSHNQNSGGANLQHAIKGSVMITIGCFSAACFMILQATTLETYPAELSLTAWICLLGTIEGGIVALVMERGNPSVWSLNWDTKLLAAVYSGIVCSGMAYYIQGVVMKVRGPVFVTTFNPLCMVIVAIMGYFFLAEQMYLGRLVGAIVIILGLYLVVWGKSKDYDSPSPTIKENILPAKQTVDESNGKEEDSNYEVITLNNSGAGNKDRDEQV
ncbi:WAT1-related protein At2g37460-like isoform X2 [Gastrolobium bilobum]|uniref:WAT1-related protein At2g37460-like isoform X2 n=1 Tax=Gastrolobium bilobum TaxID=150636 RepID=UPI002AB27F7B|nr:WAT1-related protein At2g37460-like isoform X2 [Gastrolobium bilobum]